MREEASAKLGYPVPRLPSTFQILGAAEKLVLSGEKRTLSAKARLD
jgi:hypothetical protein